MLSKKFRRGDKVVIIAGKDKGKSGEILKMIDSGAKVLISDINIAKKHMKPNKKFPDGGILSKEMPVDISNIAHIDPKTLLPTRVGLRVLDDGKKVRYAKKSGEIIDSVS